MTLTKELLASRPGYADPVALDVDILRMDLVQLQDYFAAILLQQYFDQYPSIAFLPSTATLDPERTFGKTMGSLYAYAGNPAMTDGFFDTADLPQPYKSYLTPDFRSRLMHVLIGIFEDATTGKDILARYGHTPKNPWLDRSGAPVGKKHLQQARESIIKGCIRVVRSILWEDGEYSMQDQDISIMQSLFSKTGGLTTLGELSDSIAAQEQLHIHPEHKDVLMLLKKLADTRGAKERYDFGNIIASYLALLE